jgi:dephospho-CoA kinase
MTLKVGITGGIGSGKSTVCKVIEALGFPVFYADIEAKKIIETDSQVISKISEIFGSKIYSSGRLDRKQLASIVFNDKNLLGRLNGIVHPAVAQQFNVWANSKPEYSIVFEEAAILFESGAYKHMDKTIVVTAPLDVRLMRVVNRNGVSIEDVRQRMANQFSQDDLIKLANYVIDNDGDKLILPQVLSIIENLKKL